MQYSTLMTMLCSTLMTMGLRIIIVTATITITISVMIVRWTASMDQRYACLCFPEETSPLGGCWCDVCHGMSWVLLATAATHLRLFFSCLVRRLRHILNFA